MSAQIQLRQESLTVDGEALVVEVLQMAEGDHMLVQQAADLFDVTPQAVRTEIMRHSMSVTSCDEPRMVELKALGVISIYTPQVNLLPKRTIQQLAKAFNTPRACAAVAALWNMADEALSLRDENARLIRQVSDLSLDAPITAVQQIELQVAIKERSRLFRSPHTAGAIKRDLKWKFFGPKVFQQMRLESLPQSSFLAAMATVATWNKQQSPLTPEQKRKLDAWVNATVAEAENRPEDMLKAALDLLVVEELPNE